MVVRSTGMVRRVDALGRFVVPYEIRAKYSLEPGTPIEILETDVGDLVLRRYAPGCIGCGRIDNVAEVGDSHIRICPQCAEKVLGQLTEGR